MSSFWHSSDQSAEESLGSRSEWILRGMPWYLTTCLMKSWAVSSEVVCIVVGMRCTILVARSVKMRTVSYEVVSTSRGFLGKLIQSILTDCHF